MRIRLGQYYWSAGLAITLLAGAAVGLFVFLGAWQLQRAGQKTVLYESFSSGESRVLTSAPATLGDARYATVRILGSYVPDRQVLIDNMTQAGRVGYQVLTPLRIPGESRWLVINRGWVPAPVSRSELPSITVPADERIVHGIMDRLPQPGLRLPATAIGAEPVWPRVMLFPDFEDLAEALEMPVYDYQLLLDPADDDGFARVWAPRVMGPAKHRAYAAQWFGFGLLAVVLVVVLNLSKEQPDG
jgi:surfeit locus 1 family protein